MGAYRAGLMDDDVGFAWSSAANLLLYDADPGERSVQMGRAGESRVVDRRAALTDVYARQVLVHCAADSVRLAALRAECADRHRLGRLLREGRRAVRHRRQHSSPGVSGWPWGALSPRTLAEQRELWVTAEQIVALAQRMVDDAGAGEDRRARERLLASTSHTLTFDILGAMLPVEVEQESAAELSARLEEIDRAPDPGDPPSSRP